VKFTALIRFSEPHTRGGGLARFCVQRSLNDESIPYPDFYDALHHLEFPLGFE
jgi:hypothetical protein